MSVSPRSIRIQLQCRLPLVFRTARRSYTLKNQQGSETWEVLLLRRRARLDSVARHRLSLARSGGGTVGPGAGSGGTVRLALDGGGLDQVRVGKGSLGHASKALATARRLALLLVRGEVEGDEEDQVGAEGDDTSKGSELLASALASVGHPGPVGRGEVGVRGEVDEAEVNDKLDDLEAGNPLLPPAADTTGALEVVPVHDDVDREVQANDDPRDRGRAHELSVAEESGGTMVIAVEEG